MAQRCAELGKTEGAGGAGRGGVGGRRRKQRRRWGAGGGGGERKGVRGEGVAEGKGKPEGDGACMLTDATGCRSPL